MSDFIDMTNAMDSKKSKVKKRNRGGAPTTNATTTAKKANQVKKIKCGLKSKCAWVEEKKIDDDGHRAGTWRGLAKDIRKAVNDHITPIIPALGSISHIIGDYAVSRSMILSLGRDKSTWSSLPENANAFSKIAGVYRRSRENFTNQYVSAIGATIAIIPTKKGIDPRTNSTVNGIDLYIWEPTKSQWLLAGDYCDEYFSGPPSEYGTNVFVCGSNIYFINPHQLDMKGCCVVLNVDSGWTRMPAKLFATVHTVGPYPNKHAPVFVSNRCGSRVYRATGLQLHVAHHIATGQWPDQWSELTTAPLKATARAEYISHPMLLNEGNTHMYVRYNNSRIVDRVTSLHVGVIDCYNLSTDEWTRIPDSPFIDEPIDSMFLLDDQLYVTYSFWQENGHFACWCISEAKWTSIVLPGYVAKLCDVPEMFASYLL